MNRKPICLCLLLGGMVILSAQAPLKKVNHVEAKAAIVSKVAPEYPKIARQMRLEGTVELEATVTEEGKVSQVAIISGNPLLTKAGADALKRWKFTPFQEDGKPVTALAPVSITFRLEAQ